MVGLSILMFVTSVILAMVVFRQNPDQGVVSNRRAKWFLGGGLILMGAYGVFWLIFGIGEMLSGDLSGVIHFIPVLMIVILMLLAIMRPLEAGIVLVGLGIFASIFTNVLIGGIPFLVFGLLFLAGAAVAHLGR
ncbi:MAG: hypothetical protein JW953_03705 [Anaerolineae bacterium]|nr:hypothetical protein [Anaerolineae bacterium]